METKYTLISLKNFSHNNKFTITKKTKKKKQLLFAATAQFNC